jgi:hypothetical protein
MQCDSEKNKKACTCTYAGCSKRGRCCECVAYHLSRDELPGCFFPADVEKTYDRSRAAYIKAFSR